MTQEQYEASRLRAWAQYITLGAALLSGAFWVLELVANSDTLGTISSVFAAATAVGGVAMGAIYARYRLSGRQK